MKFRICALHCLAIPFIALVAAGCSDSDSIENGAGGGAGGASGHAGAGQGATAGSGHAGRGGGSDAGGGSDDAGSAGTSVTAGAAGTLGSAGSAGTSEAAGSGGESGNGDLYSGPTVGRAKTFAALAYSAITAANISTVTGELGVSAGAVSKITGFDAPGVLKYGTDSLAPNDQRTLLAQQDVTALVGNIDPRACDTDLTNVVGGLTGAITLHPGVTCMRSFSADVLVNGTVTLDAGGDPNAFFIIRGNLTLTVADAAHVVLSNGAQACGVFWRFAKQVTIGKAVAFQGTVISGTAITMNSSSVLNGRALAQTAGVSLDANAITIPTASSCTHVQ